MKYSDEQIKRNIKLFVQETHQREIKHLIPYLLGFYGYITNQIWRCVTELAREGVVTWEV